MKPPDAGARGVPGGLRAQRLIATGHSVDASRDSITADTLGFLSEGGLYAFTDGSNDGFCDACFTGRYPMPVADDAKARQLVLFEVKNP